VALLDNTHYVDSAGYTAVTAWAANTAISAGALRRPTAAAAGNERVVICIVAGTTHATTEPTWTTSRGAKNTDNTVTWQECTGLAGVNGDITNTPTWDQYKASTSAGTLGQLIKNNAGTHLFIMSTAGTIGASQPTFNTTTGNTTADNAATWTCIGAVGAFTGNQAPHARMVNALTSNWSVAGNTIFAKSSHAATTSGALTLGGPSTLASPQQWLCHDGAAYPPLGANITTGASETSSGGSATVSALGLYCEGFTISSTAGSSNVQLGQTNTAKQKFKNCTFVRGGSSGSIYLGRGSPVSYLELENPVFSFANVNNSLTPGSGTIVCRGGSFTGAAVPTTLIAAGDSYMNAGFNGVDFSTIGSGKTIAGNPSTLLGLLRFSNCKFDAAVTVAATPLNPQYRHEFFNCSSGAVNYNSQIYDYTGTLTTETTIVRTGGASDGTTPISWKIVTTANAKFIAPFECPPISIWNETTGSSVTATIQGIWGGGAVPNDDEIWVDVEYLSASGTPISSFVSDAKATVVSTAAGQSSSSETWGGSTTAFKLGVTFTPQMKGFVVARVKAGKASATFYVDPKITLS
jgi:hypothetical protein